MRRSGSSGIQFISSDLTNSRPVYSSGFSTFSTLHSKSTSFCFPDSGVMSAFAVQFISSSTVSLPLMRSTVIVILWSFFIGSVTNPTKTNVIIFLSFLGINPCNWPKDKILLNLFFNFICFPFPTLTSLSVEILLILNISSNPSKATNCWIIILTSVNSSCDSHFIFILPLRFFLGNLHLTFSPVIKTISNSISFPFFGLYSVRRSPSMKKTPVFSESLVSINVAFNTGTSSLPSPLV